MSDLLNQKKIIRRPEAQSLKTKKKDIIEDIIPLEKGAKVKVIPMGGLCEIGKNTWIFEANDKIVLLDAGLGFPGDDMPGVNIVLPELTYLRDNHEKVAGMILTHGHEDHIGGIVNMLRTINVPIIYGPPLAIGLLEGKLKEHGLLSKTILKRIEPRDTVTLKPFAFTWLRNNHSIPDSFSMVIQTPAGRIVHSGDFKFDHTPVDGELFDIAGLAEAGAKGVELLISDSTNAEKAGYTPSERAVFPKIEEVFAKANKRIIITTFASQVHRVKQILEIAQKYGRKVAIFGRSMMNIALISRQLGYMHFPDGLLIRGDEINNYPLNKIAVLTTGSQGEPLSALTRIAKGTHRQIQVIPGDTVVISATPIPGNERSVAATINALFGRGAEVVYGREAGVHVSGHCSQEEQKLMLSLVNPKFFMPAHGEYRMLVKHGKIGEEVCNLPPENVFIMENGDVLEVSQEGAAITGEVPAGVIMVENNGGDGNVNKELVQARNHLSSQGVVNVVLTFNGKKLISQPEVVFKGLVFPDGEKSLELKRKIIDALVKQYENKIEDQEKIESNVKKIVKEILLEIKHTPPVQVLVLKPELVSS